MSLLDVPIVKYAAEKVFRIHDQVPVEEPLEIFINDEPFHMTMRLPGEEVALALGFCFTEGIIDGLNDTLSVNYCQDVSSNRMMVYLHPTRAEFVSAKLRRKRTTSYSSCGVCGKEVVADLCSTLEKARNRVQMGLSKLLELQQTTEGSQKIFRATGGTHAAAIFSVQGELMALSEDIGRHNALDKAIGKVLLGKAAGEAGVLILTSRLSYEMVQKAARLGLEIVAGASAPTSLAISLAESVNVTLVGFLRHDGGNVYSGAQRIS